MLTLFYFCVVVFYRVASFRRQNHAVFVFSLCFHNSSFLIGALSSFTVSQYLAHETWSLLHEFWMRNTTKAIYRLVIGRGDVFDQGRWLCPKLINQSSFVLGVTFYLSDFCLVNLLLSHVLRPIWTIEWGDSYVLIKIQAARGLRRIPARSFLDRLLGFNSTASTVVLTILKVC